MMLWILAVQIFWIKVGKGGVQPVHPPIPPRLKLESPKKIATGTFGTTFTQTQVTKQKFLTCSSSRRLKKVTSATGFYE